MTGLRAKCFCLSLYTSPVWEQLKMEKVIIAKINQTLWSPKLPIQWTPEGQSSFRPWSPHVFDLFLSVLASNTVWYVTLPSPYWTEDSSPLLTASVVPLQNAKPCSPKRPKDAFESRALQCRRIDYLPFQPIKKTLKWAIMVTYSRLA